LIFIFPQKTQKFKFEQTSIPKDKASNHPKTINYMTTISSSW